MYSRQSRCSSRSPSPYYHRCSPRSPSPKHHRRLRYSPRSPSPYRPSGKCTRSLSRATSSRSRSRSRSWDLSDVANPGNALYVTGLSCRISKIELKEHFASEGKVVDVHLVTDPYTRESRGFGFVTMASIEEAEKCIKYLDGSVLDGRAIRVEKAKRRRGRTPTPGRYLGPTAAHVHSRRSSSPGRERFDFPFYYRRSIFPYSRRRYDPSLEYSRSPSTSALSRVNRRWKSRSRSISRTSRRRAYKGYSRSISPIEHRRLRSSSRSTSPVPARRTKHRKRVCGRKSSKRRPYCRSNSRSARRRTYRGYSRSITPTSASSGRSP